MIFQNLRISNRGGGQITVSHRRKNSKNCSCGTLNIITINSIYSCSNASREGTFSFWQNVQEVFLVSYSENKDPEEESFVRSCNLVSNFLYLYFRIMHCFLGSHLYKLLTNQFRQCFEPIFVSYKEVVLMIWSFKTFSMQFFLPTP